MDVEIALAEPAETAPALELVFQSPTSGRPAVRHRVRALIDACRRGDVDLSGLFVVRDGGRLLTACLVLVSPGHTGILWPSQAISSSPHAASLLDACHRWAEARGVVLMQASLDPAEHELAEALTAHGYNFVARLLYMRRAVGRSDGRTAEGGLCWESYGGKNAATFAEVIRATYEKSQDCPAWNDRRPVDDVIAGHKAEGVFNPDTWLLARVDDAPVGCILLNEVPEYDSLDVVYMGVVPSARARRLGMALVRKALQVAKVAGFSKVTLAVDDRNEAALRIYRSIGFRVQTRRTVYGRALQ